jgi:hypothetical protein
VVGWRESRGDTFFDGDGFRDRLAGLVAIQSTSQDAGHMPDVERYLSDAIRPWLERLGFTVAIHPNPREGFGPILTAESIEAAGLPTVLTHGHGPSSQSPTSSIFSIPITSTPGGRFNDSRQAGRNFSLDVSPTGGSTASMGHDGISLQIVLWVICRGSPSRSQIGRHKPPEPPLRRAQEGSTEPPKIADRQS